MGGNGWCGSSAHPRGHTVWPSISIQTALSAQCVSARKFPSSRRLSRVCAMVYADLFCTGRVSLHLVKWSDSTSILVISLGVGVSGPTRSMKSTCQSQPVCSRCLFLFKTGRPDKSHMCLPVSGCQPSSLARTNPLTLSSLSCL